MNTYRMLYRPPGYATLPSGLFWTFTEVPRGYPNPFNVPVSSHPFGVFKADRPLTADELRAFEIEEVA